ncbi:hypothetical protein EFP30_00005 [Lactiplantibacillus pentosus]|nr:hypothetical protein [Lactiplantibacillus pentosus]
MRFATRNCVRKRAKSAAHFIIKAFAA